MRTDRQVRNIIWASGAAALAVAVGASVTARAQPRLEEIQSAIAAAMQNGPRRCLLLEPDSVDIHVTAPPGASLIYPATGITAPLRHAFVLWAGPADGAVPALVADLAERGLLKRTLVDAVVHREVPAAPPAGHAALRSGEWFRHERTPLAVAIYETRGQDSAFEYNVRSVAFYTGVPGPSFPSEIVPDSGPPEGVEFMPPLAVPYSLSVVAAACLPETVASISNVRELQGWSADPDVLADVVFDEHPPDWMGTSAFRRAAFGRTTAPLDRPRRAVLVFRRTNGILGYVGEHG